MRDRKEVDLDGRIGEKELEGVKGGKAITRIYYVKKKTAIFKKRGKMVSENSGVSCI